MEHVKADKFERNERDTLLDRYGSKDSLLGLADLWPLPIERRPKAVM